MAARWTRNRPDSLHAFNVRFPDEEACADYLIAHRWPQGFRCPKCPSEKGYRLASHLQKFECAKCGHQTSATAGTIMHRTHLPLRTWFLAGRVRLQVIADYTRPTLHGFVEWSTVPGSIITTDGNKSYIGVPEREHRPRDLRWMPAHVYMPWVHRLFGNLKRWGLGTFHGFRKKHLQAYLDEFTYRWNRRKWVGSAFDRLLGLAGAHEPLGYRRLVTGA